MTAADHNGGSVLVVMEDGNRQFLCKIRSIRTHLGACDIFQHDRAEYRSDVLDRSYDLILIFGVKRDWESLDAGKLLYKERLCLP